MTLIVVDCSLILVSNENVIDKRVRYDIKTDNVDSCYGIDLSGFVCPNSFPNYVRLEFP